MERLRAREIGDDEGVRLVGSCGGQQRVDDDLAAGADELLSAQGMDVAAIAKVALTK